MASLVFSTPLNTAPNTRSKRVEVALVFHQGGAGEKVEVLDVRAGWLLPFQRFNRATRGTPSSVTGTRAARSSVKKR